MRGKFDFGGYATVNNVRCSDGRTIMKDAFIDNDGQTVPLVYQHVHTDPMNVLGHALLENRDDGVYAYCSFNDTAPAQHAKASLLNGDLDSLSIYANHLKQQGGNVIHGQIREVSLVLCGANPEARIDTLILEHADGTESEIDDEAIISYNQPLEELNHAEEESAPEESADVKDNFDETLDSMNDNQQRVLVELMEGVEFDKEEAAKVIASMNEDQRALLDALVGKTISHAEELEELEESEDLEEEESVKHNVFDNEDQRNGMTLSHADMEVIIKNAKSCGSFKEALQEYVGDTLMHDDSGEPVADAYGIANIDWLFPEDRYINNLPPEFIKRDTNWVSEVMSAVHHTPFSRIKSMFADITADEARAKGYIKGNKKKEEIITLLKRRTGPTTVYKKQKIDRDDQIDITDFAVIPWIKSEMRLMLDEELARAFLIGDGRPSDSEDKIDPQCIRPVYTDSTDVYTINTVLSFGSQDPDQQARAVIRAAVKSRKGYKGSGNPVLFTTEDWLTDMLLIEDSIGHRLYKTEQELATAIRVRKIVTVPVMENVTRVVNGRTRALIGIIVNLNDYNVGADKGGAVNTFEDFDIDYNQEKYLIETRCSGALIKPFSAIILESDEGEAPSEEEEVTPGQD